MQNQSNFKQLCRLTFSPFAQMMVFPVSHMRVVTTAGRMPSGCNRPCHSATRRAWVRHLQCKLQIWDGLGPGALVGCMSVYARRSSELKVAYTYPTHHAPKRSTLRSDPESHEGSPHSISETPAPILGHSFESSGALPRGHASSQSTTTRLHLAFVTITQRPTTRAVPARANIAPAALEKPSLPCATSRAPSRSSAISWARAAERYWLLA